MDALQGSNYSLFEKSRLEGRDSVSEHKLRRILRAHALAGDDFWKTVFGPQPFSEYLGGYILATLP
jgi:hypothetical protein